MGWDFLFVTPAGSRGKPGVLNYFNEVTVIVIL